MVIFKQAVAIAVTIIAELVALWLCFMGAKKMLDANHDVMDTLFLVTLVGFMALAGVISGTYLLMAKLLGIDTKTKPAD